jgi:hypothetical protein
MLDEHLHVINCKTKEGESVDDVLADFFLQIQEELDARAGKRLRAAKPEVFEEVDEKTFEATTKAPDSATLLSSSSNLCFVLMPFGEPFDEVYSRLIRPAIEGSGLEPMRADQISYPGPIMEQIRSAIQQSRMCVVDLTGRNPNVLYELGIAQTLAKPTILLSRELDDVPFDIRQHRIIIYGTSPTDLAAAEKELAKAVQAVLGMDRLDEAKRLINDGMLRAAVSLLGILLEHSLRVLVSKYDLKAARVTEHTARPLTMGQMVDLLVKKGVISRNLASSLRRAITLRNRAVHELAEPSRREADSLLRTVESFVRRHIADAR